MRCVILCLIIIPILSANLAAQEPSNQPLCGDFPLGGDLRIAAGAVIQGKQITGVPATGEFEVSGNARLQLDGNYLDADRVKGNVLTHEFVAENARIRFRAIVMKGAEIKTRRVPIPDKPGEYRPIYIVRDGLFTTCLKDDQHYKLTARAITIEPERRAVAKHASLYLGKVKFLTLPRLPIRLGEDSSSESLLPEPGYTSQDGWYVWFQRDLTASKRSSVELDVRLTQRAGMQGGFWSSFLLSGESPGIGPEEMLNLRTRPTNIPGTRVPNSVLTAQIKAPHFGSKLHAFANYQLNRRIYDIDAREILVDTRPELGLRWISGQFRLPLLKTPVVASARASYGRFSESRLAGTRARLDLRGSLATPPLPVLKDTYIQPAVYLRKSDYSGGDSFSVGGASLDVTRAIGRAYVSGRLLQHSSSGSTPLESDDIDRFREIHGSFFYGGKRDGLGLVLRYGLEKRNLYDWEFTFTRKFDCLQPTFTWENRFGLFRIDLKVLGLE